MSLASALLALTLIWAAIHVVHHLTRRSASRSLLPLTSTSSTTTVVLKAFHLRIHTTHWNLSHDILGASLKSPPRITTLRFLKAFYDFGSVLGVLGMLAALAFLLLTSGTSALSLFYKIWPSEPSMVSTVKRSLDAPSPIPQNTSFIKPIIPGITVPLSHLPLILLSVFLAQIVHELGHAIAAALDALPLLSTGISFTVLIPSAFVTFSNGTLEGLPPRARARVISAGAFHNILLWCLLLLLGLLGSTGLGDTLWSLGYTDVGEDGRVVMNVDSESPLYGYLPIGSLITALDDTPLGSTNASSDLWSSYLLDPNNTHDDSLGWCAPLPATSTNNTCCTTPKTPTSTTTCFVSLADPLTKACLDPLPILGHTTASKRCSSDSQCAATEHCITPDISEHLLRLMVRRPKESAAEVILWSGPGIEVWEEVKVGRLFPRISLLPVSLPHTFQVFWSYLLTATLSLFFFNLLPLPYLDGAQFLVTILDACLDPRVDGPRSSGFVDEFEEYDLEAFHGQPQPERRSRGRRWNGVLSWLVPEMTLGLVGICMLLGVLNVYWR